MACYIYDGCSKPDSIRLIMLLPGRWQDPVHCLLFHSTIAEKRYYAALSYVWGDQNKVDNVFNGRKL
jgi:hypothetical protein